MPIFEYRCGDCRRRFSALVGVVADAAAPRCPRCGSEQISKLISRFAVARSEDDMLDALADPDKVGDLIRVFNGISEELHNHYALAYSPKKAPDGSYRAITLKLVNRPDVQVRVRKGYFAVKRKRPPATPKPPS